MEKIIYRAASGAQFDSKKAQVYGEALAALMEDQDAPLSPHEIIQEARKKKSVLHDVFEWDDANAGIRWRVQQANHLTNHIKIVLNINEEEIEQKAFFSVVVKMNGDTKRGYKTIRAVIADLDLREQVISGALRELIGWQQRYKEYSELADIFTAIEKTQIRLDFNLSSRD